jgi:kanamycin kinase
MRFLAGPPVVPVAIPAVVGALAGDASVQCVWQNQLGGLTFEIADPHRFVKWAPPGARLSLRDEAERLRWASAYTPVPEVVDVGTAPDGSTWLLTRALAGTTAIADCWKAAARTAVRAIGEGLRAMHDALPVATCPFSWSVEERLQRAHEPMGVDPPPVDRLVVCHGDACAPNTLLGDDGRWSGHVDLGRLGVADRWADLAIATWSTTWNYGPGWENELLAAYGVEPDDERTAFYRLLWDLTD